MLATPFPLPQLPPHTVAKVCAVGAEDGDSTRLRSLGICVGRRIQLVSAGDPLIVRVLGTRVGISARLASSVLVDRLEEQQLTIQNGAA